MAIVIVYTISNEENFEEVGLGEPDPLTTLTPIYGNRDFSFDLNFSGTDDETGNPIEITGITVSAPDYILSSYNSSTITILKDPGQLIFEGEKYRFIRFETQETFEYENLNDIEEGLSIVGWDTPTEEVVIPLYEFTITYDIPLDFLTDQVTTFTLEQELHWDYLPGWTNLQQQVSNSES